MLKCILYLTECQIHGLSAHGPRSPHVGTTSLPAPPSVCSYPVGRVLDLSDHSLRVGFERTGDHDEAHKLEAALQCLPLDLPGLLTDVGRLYHLSFQPASSVRKAS